jgi:hypothetical protein
MVAIGTAWATILTTVTVGMVQDGQHGRNGLADNRGCFSATGYLDEEMDSATTIGTVQPGMAMTVKKMGACHGNAAGLHIHGNARQNDFW